MRYWHHSALGRQVIDSFLAFFEKQNLLEQMANDPQFPATNWHCTFSAASGTFQGKWNIFLLLLFCNCQRSAMKDCGFQGLKTEPNGKANGTKGFLAKKMEMEKKFHKPQNSASIFCKEEDELKKKQTNTTSLEGSVLLSLKNSFLVCKHECAEIWH